MAEKITYTKEHKTYEEQIALLRERGMIIDDEAFALKTLQHINYYRLGFYWHSFEKDNQTHEFQENVHFNDIVDIYNFDRKLRALVMDAIERIEISVRTQWTYHLSAKYGAHAQMQKDAYTPKGEWKESLIQWVDTISHLVDAVKSSKEKFIKSILKKYKEPLPPIWAVSEIMTLGTMSRWIKNLHDGEIKRNIANTYNVHPKILESWLYNLTGVRNRCAHHSYLWNIKFELNPPMHTTQKEFLYKDSLIKDDNRLFNTITIILYLLDNIEPSNDWRHRFRDLLIKYPNIPIDKMGFPDDWESRKIWK